MAGAIEITIVFVFICNWLAISDENKVIRFAKCDVFSGAVRIIIRRVHGNFVFKL